MEEHTIPQPTPDKQPDVEMEVDDSRPVVEQHIRDLSKELEYIDPVSITAREVEESIAGKAPEDGSKSPAKSIASCASSDSEINSIPLSVVFKAKPPTSSQVKPRPVQKAITEPELSPPQRSIPQISLKDIPSSVTKRKTLHTRRVIVLDSDTDMDEERTQGAKRARLSAVANNSPHVSPQWAHPLSQNPLSDIAAGKLSLKGHRHEKYWYLDGSVVIQIDDTMFRLHRSQLTAQSEYFRKLFSGEPAQSTGDGSRSGTSEGTEEQGYVDRCPVYKIYGVSVCDFERLLHALHNAISYVFKPPTFTELASLLRASKTLSFSSIHSYAAYRLREMWPITLPKYNKISVGSTIVIAPPEYAAATVVLGRNYDMPELLKRAFYELLCMSSLGQPEDDDGSEFSSDDDKGELESIKISRADLVRLIGAREQLSLRWLLSAGSPPNPEDSPCPLVQKRRKPCRSPRKHAGDWNKAVMKSHLFEEHMYNPVRGLEMLCTEIDWVKIGFCGECVKMRKDLWSRERERLWDLLGVWLGLEKVVEEKREEVGEGGDEDDEDDSSSDAAEVEAGVQIEGDKGDGKIFGGLAGASEVYQ